MLGIAIYNRKSHFQTIVDSDLVSLGSATAAAPHVTIDDPLVAARQLELRRDGENCERVGLTNRGASIALHAGPRVHRNKTIELPLPCFMFVGDTHIQLYNAEAKFSIDSALTQTSSSTPIEHESSTATQCAPGGLTVAAWFESLSHLQKSIAGSDAFFQEAARAIFNPGGLDGGIVLKPKGTGWEVTASYIPYPEFGISYRQDIVERVADSKHALFHDSRLLRQDESTNDVHSCVAVPVLDQDENVTAVIYGFRSQHRTNHRRGIRPLEAQFVRLVADSVGAALIRMQTEAKEARARVLLEQAFAPAVARQLESNPEILQGRNRVVSILFADLRGFSTISERIGPQDTYRLMTDIMDRFSGIITNHEGVIIDYYGDGVSAFWNAPLDQENHAILACETALALTACLPELNQSWQTLCGQPIEIGIGVNSGIAQVGNSGSSNRLKYGPRGNCVNIASRLENATKSIGIPFLVSGETRQLVKHHFCSRRICTTRLKGIQSPIDIFEVANFDAHEPRDWDGYAKALDEFESRDWGAAIELLTELHLKDGTDRAAEFLFSQCLAEKEATLGRQAQVSPNPQTRNIVALAVKATEASRGK